MNQSASWVDLLTISQLALVAIVAVVMVYAVRRASAPASRSVQALQSPQGFLDAYQAQGLEHARVSFTFSIVFACVGFMLVGLSLYQLVLRESPGVVAQRLLLERQVEARKAIAQKANVAMENARTTSEQELEKWNAITSESLLLNERQEILQKKLEQLKLTRTQLADARSLLDDALIRQLGVGPLQVGGGLPSGAEAAGADSVSALRFSGRFERIVGIANAVSTVEPLAEPERSRRSGERLLAMHHQVDVIAAALRVLGLRISYAGRIPGEGEGDAVRIGPPGGRWSYEAPEASGAGPPASVVPYDAPQLMAMLNTLAGRLNTMIREGTNASSELEFWLEAFNVIEEVTPRLADREVPYSPQENDFAISQQITQLEAELTEVAALLPRRLADAYSAEPSKVRALAGLERAEKSATIAADALQRAEDKLSEAHHEAIATQASMTDKAGAVFGTVAGVITQAVAGLFFFMSRRTHQQMMQLVEQRKVESVLPRCDAFINGIADGELRARASTALALTLVESKLPPDAIVKLLSKA